MVCWLRVKRRGARIGVVVALFGNKCWWFGGTTRRQKEASTRIFSDTNVGKCRILQPGWDEQGRTSDGALFAAGKPRNVICCCGWSPGNPQQQSSPEWVSAKQNVVDLNNEKLPSTHFFPSSNGVGLGFGAKLESKNIRWGVANEISGGVVGELCVSGGKMTQLNEQTHNWIRMPRLPCSNDGTSIVPPNSHTTADTRRMRCV